LAGTFVLVLALYRESTLYLGSLWSQFGEGPYGHGFLVLAIVVFLIYRSRERLRVLAPCPDIRALPAIAVCVLAWTAATLADVQLVQAVSLLPLILALAWAMAGATVARVLLFPVLFTVFALPVWSPLLPELREMTASGAFILARISGIPAFLEDYVVYLPSGQLSIDEACSGLHYLLAALTLGTFYSWLNYRNFPARALVVVMTAAAAILANILRVAVIIYLAHYTDMQHPMVKHHLMLGWYLFGALVLVLLFVDHLLYRTRSETVSATVPRSNGVDPGGCSYSPARRMLLLTGVTLLILSGPVIAEWIKSRPAAVPDSMPRLPPGQSGWSGPSSPNDDWTPVYHGASELRGDYHKDNVRVLVYVGFYPRQSQGSELINDLNSLSNLPQWQQVGGTLQVTSDTGLSMLETVLLSADGQRRLVWYVYRVGGRYTTSRYMAKVLQVLGLLTGQRGAAVVVLAVDSDKEFTRARPGLEEFLAAMQPVLTRVAGGRQDVQEYIR
jgi:exosortase A